jgi:hypothetical protein
MYEQYEQCTLAQLSSSLKYTSTDGMYRPLGSADTFDLSLLLLSLLS